MLQYDILRSSIGALLCNIDHPVVALCDVNRQTGLTDEGRSDTPAAQPPRPTRGVLKCHVNPVLEIDVADRVVPFAKVGISDILRVGRPSRRGKVIDRTAIVERLRIGISGYKHDIGADLA